MVTVVIPDIRVELVPKGQQSINNICWCFFTIFLALATCILGVVLAETNPTPFKFVSLGVTGLLAGVFLVPAIWFPRKAGGT